MGNGLRFPYLTRTEPAGTQAGSMSRERKDRSKRSSRTGGKPTVRKARARRGANLRVAKRARSLPGKAAIVLYQPVP